MADLSRVFLETEYHGDEELDDEKGVATVPDARRPDGDFVAEFDRFAGQNFPHLFPSKAGHVQDDKVFVPLGCRRSADEDRVRVDDEEEEVGHGPGPEFGDGSCVEFVKLPLDPQLAHATAFVNDAGNPRLSNVLLARVFFSFSSSFSIMGTLTGSTPIFDAFRLKRLLSAN